MATAQVAVPRGVECIVLTIDNGEVEDLRARLKDAESSNVTLAEQLSQLQSRYEELQTKYSGLAAELQHMRSPQRLIPSSAPAETEFAKLAQYPYKDEARGILALRHADAPSPKSLRKKISKDVRRRLMMTKDDTYWVDFPSEAFSGKADRRLNAKGQWISTYSKVTTNLHALDVLTRAGGCWCYAGTYAAVVREKLSAEGFKALPGKVRDALVTQAGATCRAAQVRVMLEGGEISATKLTKFTLKRVGFDENMAFSILEALKQLPLPPMGPPAVGGDESDEEE